MQPDPRILVGEEVRRLPRQGVVLAVGLLAAMAACDSVPDSRRPIVYRAPDAPKPVPVVVQRPAPKPSPTPVTPPRPQRPITPVRPAPPKPQPVPPRPAPRPVPVTPQPKPPPQVVNVKLPTPQYTVKLKGVTWVSLEAWGRKMGRSTLLRLKQKSDMIHRLVLGQLQFDLVSGSRIASCQGMQLWLGFAPKLVKGHLYLHHLDVTKHLQPLVGSMPRLGRVVVIDPGHGSSNLGTRSVYNRKYEKEYTLDWALRLKRLLEKKGWRVYLTRTRDKEVGLTDRVKFADRVKAALFISLHFNYAARAVNGLETYCIAPVGMPSHLTRGSPDNVKRSLPNNLYDTRNLQLASRVHSSLLATCRMADRGVRRIRFMTVLKGQKRPAILVEGGYLSNPTEAKRVESAAYRQKLAEGIANALP